MNAPQNWLTFTATGLTRRIFARRWRWLGWITGWIITCSWLSATDGKPIETAGNGTAPAVKTTGAMRENDPLPDGVLGWDSLIKETNVVMNASAAHFVFNFTNVSSGDVAILSVQPTCGCTEAQLPSAPWIMPPHAVGSFGLTVNLFGKVRRQIKTAVVLTDHGFKQVSLVINLQPPQFPVQSQADRLHALALAQADRQAIFRGDCTTCHVKPGAGLEGRALYYAVCASCHEGRDHATTMPDLYAIRTPTNVSFWLNWIAQGKPDSLMPAFAQDHGGSLTERQIASLARYLNTTDYLDPP